MLNLCEGELAHSDQSRPGRNLVSESVSDLGGGKWKPALVELKESLEVDKDALGSFRTEEAFDSTRGANICLGKGSMINPIKYDQIFNNT